MGELHTSNRGRTDKKWKISNNGILIKYELMGEHNIIGKSDGTMNTTIRDIRKDIDDEFNDNVGRFMVNKYSGSQMTRQPQKRRAIQLSSKWTKPTETRASLPSP